MCIKITYKTETRNSNNIWKYTWSMKHMKQLTVRTTAEEQRTGTAHTVWSEVRASSARDGARELRKLKEASIDERVVLITGSWNRCPCLRSECWFGLNGDKILYKEWFGLLAMVWKALHQPSPANSPLYRRDRRAATDVLRGTIHLYDHCHKRFNL